VVLPAIHDADCGVEVHGAYGSSTVDNIPSTVGDKDRSPPNNTPTHGTVVPTDRTSSRKAYKWSEKTTCAANGRVLRRNISAGSGAKASAISRISDRACSATEPSKRGA